MHTLNHLPSLLLKKMNDAGVRTIVIDGFTASGKSTAADGLIKLLKEEGHVVREFHADWFVIDRDKRNYKENPALMRLSSWADIPGGTKLATFLGNTKDGSHVFSAYDRSTGKRSLEMTLEPVKSDDYFVIEGLYALKMASKITRPAISVFFVMNEETTTNRLYARNTYIPRERLEYEVENIYLPSMREYTEEIRSMKKPILFIDTNTPENVTIERDQSP